MIYDDLKNICSPIIKGYKIRLLPKFFLVLLSAGLPFLFFIYLYYTITPDHALITHYNFITNDNLEMYHFKVFLGIFSIFTGLSVLFINYVFFCSDTIILLPKIHKSEYKLVNNTIKQIPNDEYSKLISNLTNDEYNKKKMLIGRICLIVRPI